MISNKLLDCLTKIITYPKNPMEVNSVMGAGVGSLAAYYVMGWLENDQLHWVPRLNIDIYVTALVYTSIKRVIERLWGNKTAYKDIKEESHFSSILMLFDVISQTNLTWAISFILNQISPLAQPIGIAQLFFYCLSGELVNQAFRKMILNDYAEKKRMLIITGIFLASFTATCVAATLNNQGEAGTSDLVVKLAATLVPSLATLVSILSSLFKKDTGPSTTNVDVACNCCIFVPSSNESSAYLLGRTNNYGS